MTEHRRFNRWEYFEPYDKQLVFFDLGRSKKERLLCAGNQLGKTEAGAYEFMLHLTGLYPSWWNGRRFDRPIRAWAAGETSTLVRDVQQKKLCGQPGVEEAFGTGFIPKHLFIERPSLARGVTDAYDTMQIRHASGGISTCTFKSYEQGRTKFQGEPVDLIWCDEEPPMDIYSECLTRTTATKGMVLITFTPLKGKSAVVIRFMDEPSEDRAMVVMTIRDVGHISKEEADSIIAGYPAHERAARANGVPMMGEGRIFPYADEVVQEPPLLTEWIPLHWTKLWSIDFGIGHAFAATLMLWDRDRDILHVHDAFKMKDALPIMHAPRMRTVAAQVPVAWPQDGTQREKSTGETLASVYRKERLLMLPDHATWEDGGNSTEAGILEMQQRMLTGRFKVAEHLGAWYEEFRVYHRKDGAIVKLNDDVMSATRVGVMAKRKGRPVPLGPKGFDRSRQGGIAKGTDFDLF